MFLSIIPVYAGMTDLKMTIRYISLEALERLNTLFSSFEGGRIMVD
jgi:hypothetical protein